MLVSTRNGILLELCDSAPIERPRVFWFLLQHIGIIGQGVVEIAERKVHHGTVLERIRMVGSDSQRFVAVGTRGRKLMKNGQFVATIGERYGLLGVEPEGFIVVANSAVMVTLVRIGVCSRAVGPSVGGVALDR